MPIRMLPMHVVNQIAAGEVVERPASVVKELIENALDAGATHVTVDLMDGGLESIRVRDDGDGIVSDELPLAIAPHATSKVETAEDLDGIATMGFRGEALASIGSVSRLEVVSRPRDAAAGARIVADHGDIGSVEAAASPPGTCMTVGRLFARVPARRKFLRTPRAETGRVRRVIRDLAAAHPGVHFVMTSDGVTRLELPAHRTLRDRLVAILGRELADSLIEIEAVRDGVSVTGVVGTPETARPASTHQIICLNGRPITDRAIKQALREAYRGLIEPSRHPVAALFIGVDPSRVDVNVHPAKTEVRLRDERLIFVVIRDAVREALKQHDLVPTMPLPEVTMPPPPRQLFGSGLAATERRVAPTPPPQTSHVASVPVDGVRPEVRWMQVHDMWLLVEDEHGVVVVDQHALHERVLFEQVLARIGESPLPAQQLMVPVAVDVDGDAAEVVTALMPLARRLGLDIAPLGPSTLAVHAAPVLLVERRVDIASFVEDLVDRAAAMQGADDETALRDVVDMMACKAAVKAGDRLSNREIRDLLEQREAIERSTNCPHGRPTSMRLTLDDLERHFGRS